MIDVVDAEGVYLGALRVALRPEVIAGGGALFMRHVSEPDARVAFEPREFPVTVRTIVKRSPGSILRSERVCMVVRDCADMEMLERQGFMERRSYYDDPLALDVYAWADYVVQQIRRDRHAGDGPHRAGEHDADH